MQKLMAEYLGEVCKPTRYLINLVPEDKYDWKPSESMMPLGVLVAHLAESPAVVYMAATEDWPSEFSGPEPMPKAEALNRFDASEMKSVEALKQLDSGAYAEYMKAPWGDEGTKFSMLMLMIDHIIHHKMQLFMYLKLLGFNISTAELYSGTPSES